MKLFVTLGNRPLDLPYTHTDSKPIVLEIELPEGHVATYLGLEMEQEEVDPDIPGTGRMTILRTPFTSHGDERTIHTICRRHPDETIDQYPPYDDSYPPGAYGDTWREAKPGETPGQMEPEVKLMDVVSPFPNVTKIENNARYGKPMIGPPLVNYVVDVWPTQIKALSAHLDYVNGTADPEIALRLIKVYEESGEVAAAWIGYTGQNPRKGVTHTKDDVVKELNDLIITAMVLVQSLGWDAETAFIHHVNKVHKRMMKYTNAETGIPLAGWESE